MRVERQDVDIVQPLHPAAGNYRDIDLSREAFQAAAITRGVAESLDLHPQPAEAA